jgi:hypothetical protein
MPRKLDKDGVRVRQPTFVTRYPEFERENQVAALNSSRLLDSRYIYRPREKD